MAKSKIELPEGTRLVITKDEHGPQEVYDRLPSARTAFIVTFNLPKAGGALLDALERATQLESLRLITNIPNWWVSYFSEKAKKKARTDIQSSIERLKTLAERDGVEIYFTRKNHSKIYVLDDVGYVGSSNFSDESANNVEAGVIIEDEDTLDELRRSSWELLRPEVRLHPTIAAALSESLADWLRDELDFESVYVVAHDWDSESAQEGFKEAVKRLVEFGQRAEAVLDDVRDDHWPVPVQAMLHEATSLDEVTKLVGGLDSSYGSIRSCIDFSFQAVIEKHIVETAPTRTRWKCGRRAASALPRSDGKNFARLHSRIYAPSLTRLKASRAVLSRSFRRRSTTRRRKGRAASRGRAGRLSYLRSVSRFRRLGEPPVNPRRDHAAVNSKRR